MVTNITMKSTHTLIVLFVLFLPQVGMTQQSRWNVQDYGAVGDGETPDTDAIQEAIDACAVAGGGRVYVQGGIFRSGTIYLKDNVTLEIEAGTTLKASNNLDDFPSIASKHSAYQKEMVTNKMLLYAEGARNIAVIGQGTIDGNGDHWVEGPYGFPSFSKRPRILHFRGCENILVRDITLYNSASWVQSYQSCKDLVIEGITVDSRENKDIEKERYSDFPGRNTDGLDLIDCERVRISDCFINSGDDAICLKSLSPDDACRDITISNCVVSSNASGIKIGTESSGRFEDITVTNCVVYDTRNDAVSIMTVDGARMERINISNISCRNIKASAIYVRLGKRLNSYRKEARINTPHLKDIIFENIQGTRISAGYGCIIAGLKDHPVENITMRNIRLQFEGGGTVEDSRRPIPEEEASYPNGRIFGRLPAYGFYIRHAENITLENIQLRTLQPDHRPAILCDDVADLHLTRVQADVSNRAIAMVLLKQTRGALIRGNRLLKPVNTLFRIEGNETSEILLSGNDFRNATHMLSLADEISKDSVEVQNF